MEFTQPIPNYNFQEIFDKYQIFENYSRKRGENISEFLTQWNEKMWTAQTTGCKYSDNLLACKLLEKVNLHQDDLTEILSLTTEVTSENEICAYILSKLELNTWRDKEEDEDLKKDVIEKVLMQIKEEGLEEGGNYYNLDNIFDDYGNQSLTIDPDPANDASRNSDPSSEDLTGSLKKKEKCHRCQLCGKTYNRPGKLKVHYKSHHNITDISKIEPEDPDGDDFEDLDVLDSTLDSSRDQGETNDFLEGMLGDEVKPKLEGNQEDEKGQMQIGRVFNDSIEESGIEGELTRTGCRRKKRNSNTKFHMCEICNKLFHRPIVLKEHHIKSHLDVLSMEEINNIYKEIKGKQVDSEQDNFDDEDISTEDSKKGKKAKLVKFHQCEYCGKWFNRPGRLKAHYKSGHKITNIDLQDDNHSTTSLPSNKAPKIEEDTFEDEVGDKSEDQDSNQKDALSDGGKKEKTVKYHQCGFCGKWVNRIGRLKQHYRFRHHIADTDKLVNEDNHQTRTIRGASCSLMLSEEAAGKEKEILASVKRKRNSNTKFHECQVCNKKFPRPIALKEHQLNVHSDVLTLQEVMDKYDEIKKKEVIIPECKICEKKFLKVECYKSHMKIHSGIKRYKCDECDASFYQNGSLRYHKLKHTGKRNYKCDQCPNDYITLGNLVCHIRRDHLNERPFKCDYCDYAALKKYDLERHMFSHVSERPIKCNICEKAFKDKVSLKVHTKKIHSTMTNVVM